MGLHAQHRHVVSALTAPPASIEPGDLSKIAPPPRSAYFLDIDGTLLEIMPRPEDVTANEELRALLMRLSRAAGGALALVSGRRIEDVDRIFAPLVFAAVGLHGAELRFADGTRVASSGEALATVRAAISDFVKARQGLRLEDKGASLAVHFRQAPQFEQEVVAFLFGLAAKNKLAVQEGKMVAELKESYFDKGKGIAALLATPPFLSRTPVFIGDDLTDESGFRFVNDIGGISVRVSDQSLASAAQFRLEGPAGVRAELKQLLQSSDWLHGGAHRS
jgi:trehalose 6-phosphate phosphatase